MLKGIDVSSHNMSGTVYNAATQKAYNESDFVIVKLTQGTSYVFGQGTKLLAKAREDGKLIGMYHYASNGDAVKEAEHFWAIAKAYNRLAIPVLDFERYQNTNNWNKGTWCRQFVNRYHELSTGVWPMIYISASERSRAGNCASDCALWIAGYPDNRTTWDVPSRFPYKVNPWATYTIWQYTSGGGVDRNVARLTADSWALIAAGGPTQVPTGTTVEVAADVIKGRYGDGDARKAALGSRYAEVQAEVTHILTASAGTLASEVLQGKYGNGKVRRKLLGFRYDEVQEVVNKSAK